MRSLALAMFAVIVPATAHAALLGGWYAEFYSDNYEGSPVFDQELIGEWDLFEPSDLPVGTRSIKIWVDHSFSHAMQYYYDDKGYGGADFFFRVDSLSAIQLGTRRVAKERLKFDLSGSVSEDEPSYDAAFIEFVYYEHAFTRGQMNRFLAGDRLYILEYDRVRGRLANLYQDGEYDFYSEWTLSVYAEFYDDPAPAGVVAPPALALFALGLVTMAGLRRASRLGRQFQVSARDPAVMNLP